MVGNPGDNIHTIRKNIKFIKQLNPDLLVVNITTPFPGTDMFNWAKERNLILSYDWDDYTLAKPIMKLENLNEREIQELYKKMYKSFYFNPKYILRKLFTIKSLNDFKLLFEGFKSLLSFYSSK